MSELRRDLVDAYENGNFLKTVSDISLSDKETSEILQQELIALHNEGAIDIVKEFKGLKNNPNSKIDFFLTSHIAEKVIPSLNAKIQTVMEWVNNLAKESGNDILAITFESFVDFCKAESSRPQNALRLVEEAPGLWMNFTSPAIVAGSAINIKYYLTEAIRLTKHENIEIRRRAIFSLGMIQYLKSMDSLKQACVCLEQSVLQEIDDYLLGNIIQSSFRLYKQDNSLMERIIAIIDKSSQ